ncbi:hypothetical protein [Algoriphagus litoralis]|uniref:hypothetical protein n=1 Tax=Algoriphagus litoralis TaxID=2202829 RepID=UPI00130077AB|nr:hypothetical protein [Algoriphagus litoralis]
MEILDSCLNAPSSPLPQNPKFQFDLAIEHRINLENNLVIVICKVGIRNESKETLFGELRGSCIFFVEKLKDYFDTETNKLSLPDDFVVTLNSVTISSMRGLMFSFFRGTFLHQAVLPIIDPKSFEKNT